MRTRSPNWWAAAALIFCLASWSLGLSTMARTANLYEHRSPAGFRHDLMVKAEHKLLTLSHVPAAPAKL